jgi:site-specific DNA recombinase
MDSGNIMQPKRVGVYCRVSTEEQAKDSASLDNQAAVCKRLIRVRWPAVEVTEFHDVGTARKTKRREYQRMMRYAKSGIVDLIVCVEMSRLWRNLGDAIRDMARLDQWDCAVQILDTGIDTTTPVGKLQFALVGALAQFESDQVSVRTRRALDELKAQGL